VQPDRDIPASSSKHFDWLDLVWLLFLGGLAVLPPRGEGHKQLILLAIGALQLLEGQLIRLHPRRGAVYAVLLKIVLATALLDHTEQLGINSNYYPIYYLPVVTAALYFGPWMTFFWTALASAAYCSYLYPALQEFELTADGIALLALRIMFFFLAAMVVNRFAQDIRRQNRRYQKLAEELAETNRRLEQAQAEARRSERLAALGQLSAGLAHEIRNPLGVIRGSAEMLNEKLKGSDELARELAGYILTEVSRLGALVTDFLGFARPLRADLHPTDVAALLDRVLKKVADTWQGKPVAVARDYQQNLPSVPLDESLCEQAFFNLAQNAYQAMEENGGGTLRLAAHIADHGGHQGLIVRFADTGPGVPENLREEIFNPFVTTKKTGVGLGLSVVSKIVDAHHGSIRLENNPGAGAIFTLFFPLAQSTELSAQEITAGSKK